MELFIDHDNETLNVRIVGEVVADTCGDLRLAIMENVSRKPRRIVLRLPEVTFMDTSGIGVLVGLRAHLKSKGIALELADPSPKVRHVLEMTRLNQVFGLPDA